MIVPTLNEEVNRMTADNYRQQVYIVAETQMHVAPWLHDEESWLESRLHWAVEAVCAGQVRDTGLAYEVQGDTAVYAIPTSARHRCPCPAAQYGPSQHCKHRVALELYMRVQQAYPQDTPLPLPPVTVDERLTQSRTIGLRLKPTMPQEDRMPDDADAYIPEPEQAPVAVADPPDRTTTAATPRPLPGPVLLPSLDARTLEQSMQAWSAQRQVVKRFLQQELVEGTDYYTLRIKGRETKPALSKAGSEKFMALFQLHAVFDQDTATWTMLGQPQGTLCYRCQLYTRSGEMVGEGRGARTIQQDGGDINKAVKMVCKSSMVDAILRTGALSDVFTQDEPEPPAPAATPTKPSSQELRQRIWALVTAQAPQQATTREAVAAWIRQTTGYELVEGNFAAIVRHLEERAC